MCAASSPSCGWDAEMRAPSQMDSRASNKGSAQHGSFFLGRSRASLFYLSAQTLREPAIFETATLSQIQLELDNALKSCQAYTHRYAHAPCEHEIHIFAGSHVEASQNQVLRE